jgi:bacterial leucyl aminopeptidase
MHLSPYLLALATSSFFQAISAAPSSTSSQIERGLRLIKTSEADAGTWVTEEEKIEKYVARDINFIDITDIKVCPTSVTLQLQTNISAG